MKIKRTLPSVIEKLKKKSAHETQTLIEMKKKDSTPSIIQNHIQIIDEEEREREENIIGQLFQKKGKIFNKKPRQRIFSSKPSRPSFADPHEIQAKEKQPTKQIEQILNSQKIFNEKEKGVDFGQGVFSKMAQQPKEKKQTEELESKVIKLQRLVQSLEKQLVNKSKGVNVDNFIQKIQLLEKSDRKKQADLRRMSLEIQQHERCSKLAQENQILYGKLTNELKRKNESFFVNEGSKFPSLHQTPRHYEDEDEEISSPFMIQQGLTSRNSGRSIYF